MINNKKLNIQNVAENELEHLYTLHQYTLHLTTDLRKIIKTIR